MNHVKITLFVILSLLVGHGFATEYANQQEQASQYLNIQEIHNSGVVIELTDGSQWYVQHFSRAWKLLGWGWTEQTDVSHWTSGDKVEILYPGSGNFVDFVLKIVNLTKKEDAYIKLMQAPSVNCTASLWIADFILNTNLIVLNDGTKWTRTNTDIYGEVAFEKKDPTLSLWEPGDPVTLIRGEGWLNSKKLYLWNHSSHEIPLIKKRDN